jgi:sterol desaturase/sphingolipid hydroxylase (fatty acid hydroxylase superfamily)
MAALVILTLYCITFLVGWAIGEVLLKERGESNTIPYQKRKPLILLNIVLLISIIAAGFLLFSDMISFSLTLPIWVIMTQALMIFFIDDAWFYWSHRYMHVNKYMLRKFHAVHHRVPRPLPLDYFYVHPVDWLFSGAGIPIAITASYLIFGVISFYAVFAWAVFKAFHELDLHSGIRTRIGNWKYMKWMTTAEYHGDHHAKFHGNYSSVFTFWDKVLKTELK